MRDKLRNDLTNALKARDHVAVSALRSALAAIDNAEATPLDHLPTSTTGNQHVAKAAVGLGAAEAERRQLTDADIRLIVENEVQERSVAVAQYESLGRIDLAERLKAEAAVLSQYL